MYDKIHYKLKKKNEEKKNKDDKKKKKPTSNQRKRNLLASITRKSRNVLTSVSVPAMWQAAPRLQVCKTFKQDFFFPASINKMPMCGFWDHAFSQTNLSVEDGVPSLPVSPQTHW